MDRLDHLSNIEPLLLSLDDRLRDRAFQVIGDARQLGGGLHPVTRKAVAGLVRTMNSYYSNLIEGNHTYPREIEMALAGHFSRDEKRRSLQQLHLAHIQTQVLMEKRLEQEPNIRITSADFLCWIHEEFYKRLPHSFHEFPDSKGGVFHVRSGEIRAEDVFVGRHLPPPAAKLRDFLNRFDEVYSGEFSRPIGAALTIAASHHRLLWIHPFMDGNGRVARLFTHAAFQIAKMNGGGLWSISRGFARDSTRYKAALDEADTPRLHDSDGRGYLSRQKLEEFCLYFLDTALDQIRFMSDVLDLDGMIPRIERFSDILENRKDIPRGASRILLDSFLRGEIRRGEAARILNKSPRTAQAVLGILLKRRLLLSDSPKGPVRIHFPADFAEYYFPRLFPAGSDDVEKNSHHSVK